MGGFVCAVCGYPSLNAPPIIDGNPSFEDCPCCGFEFGFDDGVKGETYESYRQKWVADGMRWWYRSPPPGWNPVWQLKTLER